MNTEIKNLSPGMFGVSHGSGITGELIRHATESWAGHAFIYIGEGRLIEARPPVARIAPATTYDDAIWAYRMPLTLDQGILACNKAHALVGSPYDYPAYVGFALEVLNIRTGQQLDPVFKSDTWRVCSALVDDCYQYAKIPLNWASIRMNPGQDENLVSPGMLLDLATVKGWV